MPPARASASSSRSPCRATARTWRTSCASRTPRAWRWSPRPSRSVSTAWSTGRATGSRSAPDCPRRRARPCPRPPTWTSMSATAPPWPASSAAPMSCPRARPDLGPGSETGGATIPVVSVNTDTIEAAVYRIGDRALAAAQAEGTLFSQLDSWRTSQIGDQTGEKVWSGTIEVKPELNREVTTAVPVGALVTDLKPGVYALTAKPRNGPAGTDTLPTQWFVVSDLGLAAFSGNDGLHALVRSLSGAGPMAGVRLRLVARNDEILGQATTDVGGYARLEPGLLRGTGGNAPALLVAEGPDGDYGLLDLTKTPFDLSDRGVEGRAPPKPLDVYMVTERGAYRPGETVHVTALVRDPKADAARRSAPDPDPQAPGRGGARARPDPGPGPRCPPGGSGLEPHGPARDLARRPLRRPQGAAPGGGGLPGGGPGARAPDLHPPERDPDPGPGGPARPDHRGRLPLRRPGRRPDHRGRDAACPPPTASPAIPATASAWPRRRSSPAARPCPRPRPMPRAAPP